MKASLSVSLFHCPSIPSNMSLLLSRLRLVKLRPAAASRILSVSSANFFWSSTEVVIAPKHNPVVEQQQQRASTSTHEPVAIDGDADSISTADIVKHVAETHDMSQAESRRVINTILDLIKEGVTEKKTVKIANFGCFYPFTSKATTGHNPRTGEQLDIPAKERVKFRPYNNFKKSVEVKSD
ncbi:hypothetical protein MPSEU_000096100 [Mayamaea pseudoterrestris]|nr:hypothetical protein MPSEU_000096100 [Mayamaea pseudoterrestris]